MRERGIYGLVLAEGANQEMEAPFGDLTYHDRPQWAFSAHLLAPYCDRTFILVEQASNLPDVPEEMIMTDEHPSQSPYGGVLTALQKYPDNTFFVISCKKPGIDRTVTNRLYRSRDPEMLMSCFRHDEEVDPFVSIWEAGAAPYLKKVLGSPSPLTKSTAYSDCKLIDLEDIHWKKLREVTTMQEREQFLKLYKPGKDPYQVIE